MKHGVRGLGMGGSEPLWRISMEFRFPLWGPLHASYLELVHTMRAFICGGFIPRVFY